jgi:hypothetical protein
MKTIKRHKYKIILKELEEYLSIEYKLIERHSKGARGSALSRWRGGEFILKAVLSKIEELKQLW